MNIPAVEARAIYTKQLIDVYLQSLEPTDFLRSFFPAVYSNAKELAIAVQRNLELVAVDVERGSIGNRNNFATSTEKMTTPPLYREYFDITELSAYDRAWYSADDLISASLFAELVDEGSNKIKLLRNKIERAYEVQCANILQTGIAVINAGGMNANVDFKRKAASMVDVGSANYWDTNPTTVDPVTILETGCTFLRTVGKSNESQFNLILGNKALAALQNNSFVQNRGRIFNYALDKLNPPQRDSKGAALHGFISVGSFIVLIWTYPQFYDTGVNGSTPVSNPYIEPYNAILLPSKPNFKMGFARVPQLQYIDNAALGTMSSGQDGYLVREFIDPRQAHHIIDIASVGLPIPTAVDQIWTAKVTSA